MIHTDEYDNKYYTSVDESKGDGYFPIRVKTTLQYFQLEGRKTVMSKDNLIPIPDLKYVVEARYPGGDRFFLREYRGYDIDTLYFYRRTLTFSGESVEVENLRKYVEDGRVTLIITKDQISATSEMLRRIYQAQFKTEGKLDYNIYLKLMDLHLKLEDYRDVGKNLVGFKTAINQFEKAIDELWKQGKEQKK